METSTFKSDLKKHKRQLRRNLHTLNYLFILELDSKNLGNDKRILDIQNLKESLQREVIRNTKFISDYKSQLE
ncbi:hypothetical protein [uncultured Winogradskyella sp.]|uniref:hypothetical protein n=1 Tax=uncultured Winogradskyella sp. TaxID=395353 RepID=UPI002609C34A|nr:hypothetical protein [uncultured Winogradskyella sp.]